MVAIGAVASLVGLGGLHHGSIVFLGLGGTQIVQVGLQLVKVVHTQDASADTGFGQTVGNALLGRESNAQGRSLLVQQTASTAECFHHSNADVVRSAIVIKLHAYRVNAGLQVVHGPFLPRDGTATQTVEGGIQREHNHLYPSALGGHQCHLGIVAAHTYVLYLALLLQLEDIFQEGASLQFVPLFRAVGDVYHAHLDVVGAQPLQQILKALPGLFHIAGAGMLTILEDSTDMPLYYHAVATAFQCDTDVRAGHWIGIVNVNVVHAAVKRHIHQSDGASRVQLLKASAANTNLTHFQTRVAKRTVSHYILWCLMASHCQQRHRQHQKIKLLHVQYIFSS